MSLEYYLKGCYLIFANVSNLLLFGALRLLNYTYYYLLEKYFPSMEDKKITVIHIRSPHKRIQIF
jgi:N-acyl-L-homoserine lactone synthetase